MLAVDTIDPVLRTIINAIALLLFLAGAIGLEPERSRVSLTSLGLAVFVFPVLWDSWALI